MTARRSWVAALLLALLVLAVHGRTASHGFINFDDNLYVVKNPLVRDGVTAQALRRALFPYASNWHPLTWLSHMLDVQLFGLRPGGHHLVSVLFHAANAALLFALLRALTGAAAPSLATAALFAVHPLHVESVAWVAERKDLLCAFFTLLAIGAYLRWLRRPGWPRYALVVALFGAALAAKPMAVTLPALLLILDVWPLGRARRVGIPRLLAEKTPLALLALADAFVTARAQHAGRLVRLIDPALPLRVKNAVVSCAAYLADTAWPAGLALLYPYPLSGIPAGRVAGAALLLAGISAVAWRARRREPALLAGWLWYLVALLPVVGLHQVGAQARADRYTYLPLTGIFVAVLWWAAPRIPRRMRRLATAGAAAALAALAAAAWVQVGYWRDSASIMRRTASVTGPNAIALNNLGRALLDDGRRPEEAVALFEQAIAIEPHHRNARFNLGEALFRLGRYEGALEAFRRVLALTPVDPESSFAAAAALFRLGRYEESAAAYERILAADPQDVEARYFLGVARLKLGLFAEAARQFATIVEHDPAYRDARVQLAASLDGASRAGATRSTVPGRSQGHAPSRLGR